jgi:branched-chain amino acid transport system permease protein
VNDTMVDNTMVIAADLGDTAQLAVSGIATGCLYALVALGFVVVYKATGVLNLAQGGFVSLGAYLTYTGHQLWGLPFWLATVFSIVCCAVVAAAVERVFVRRVAVGAIYAALLVTFGVLIVFPPVISGIWGNTQLNLGDPWGLDRVDIGAVSLTTRDVAVVVITTLVVAAFFVFFRLSRLGVAMRATASDPEAAMAQGVDERLVYGGSWALAGALGAISGTLLATAVGGGLQPALVSFALLALPVIILGGLDSPVGAVVGGLIIGVAQQFATVSVPEAFGSGFTEVVPYLVMIVILLIRPQGLFGTKHVRRV